MSYASLVKLPRRYRYLQLPDNPDNLREFIGPTKDTFGAKIKQAKAILLTGNQAGTEVDSVAVNQTVKIVPAIDFTPEKYVTLVGYNPKLAEYGSVTCSSFLEAGEQVSLVFKARKQLDLSELEYFFNIYMII